MTYALAPVQIIPSAEFVEKRRARRLRAVAVERCEDDDDESNFIPVLVACIAAGAAVILIGWSRSGNSCA